MSTKLHVVLHQFILAYLAQETNAHNIDAYCVRPGHETVLLPSSLSKHESEYALS